MKIPILTGRLPFKKAPFHQVVGNLRHAIFSVIRQRPEGAGFRATALGSGFFVAADVFMTCYHVINQQKTSHQDGDGYLLVNNFGETGRIHAVSNVRAGSNLHLFRECDLALLKLPVIRDQAYVNLEYGEVPVGKEIGVAGYPLPRLMTENDKLRFDGLLYRVAKGVVTARYNSSIQEDELTLPVLPIIEVNFLFVPGNSGGPIFDVETGRVLGFVHGFQYVTVREALKNATQIAGLPAERTEYIENLHAIYSLGIKLDCVRNHLDELGVTL